MNPDTLRIVDADEARPGDFVLCGGRYKLVRAIVCHGPNTHPESPILNHLYAREVVTEDGSRWSGYRTRAGWFA